MHSPFSFLVSFFCFSPHASTLPIDLASPPHIDQLHNTTCLTSKAPHKLYKVAQFPTFFHQNLQNSQLSLLKWKTTGALWIIASTPTQVLIASHNATLAPQDHFQVYPASGNQTDASPLLLPNGNALIGYISNHEGTPHLYINRYKGSSNQLLSFARQITPDTNLARYAHPQLFLTSYDSFITLYERQESQTKIIFGKQYSSDMTLIKSFFLINNPYESQNQKPFGASLKDYFFASWTCQSNTNHSWACGRFLSFFAQPLTSVFPIDHRQTPTEHLQEHTTDAASFPYGGIVTTFTRYNSTAQQWSLWGKIYNHKENLNNPPFAISNTTLSNPTPLKVAILQNNIMLFSFFKNKNYCLKALYKNLTTALHEYCAPNEGYHDNTLLVADLDYGRFALGRTATSNNHSLITIYQLETPTTPSPTSVPFPQPRTWWDQSTTKEKIVVFMTSTVAGFLFLITIALLIAKKIKAQQAHLQNMIALQKKASQRKST